MKKSIIFSYFGFKRKNVLSDCFLISHVHIDMGERIAGKQDRPSLIIEKNGFQIVSPCCPYVSTVMRSAFADILVPLVPLDFM